MKVLLTVCLLVFAGAVFAAEIDCGAMKASFDSRGRLTRLASAKGMDFLYMARDAPADVWRIRLVRTDDLMVSKDFTASEAKDVVVKEEPSGAVMRFSGFDEGLESVVVGVKSDRKDGKLRWRIQATPSDGWALYWTEFPKVNLGAIGKSAMDDAVLGGLGHSGILRNPSAPRWRQQDPRPVRAASWAHGCVYGRQPGALAAQFVTYWDSTAGFYCACEDGKGYAKEVSFTPAQGGAVLLWRRFGYSEQTDKQDFDIVMSAFDGDAEHPVDWYDAADLYKKWALTQHWCRTPLKFREDLPAWTKNAPAMLTFYTSWVEHPEKMHDFFADYWTKRHPGVPVAAGLVGWEKHGEWVSLDYFPMHPSDEITRATMADLKTFDAHPWPWPSGHYWTLTKGRKPDGSFTLDFRKDFERLDGPDMSCLKQDGSLNTDNAGWLSGGQRACLCPGYAKARDFWVKNVCLELVKRGAEMIQSDQDTGAHVPECWSRKHGHLPGEGRWKTVDMYNHYRETVAECRKIEPGLIITFEEPNEHFNDILFIQDHRNCRFNMAGRYDWEWADVFGYLYHEYVAPFQSDVINGNSFWWTHAAVEGHMPYARFYDQELKFENAFPGKTRQFLEQWVDLYHGKGRDWLAHGRHIRPPRHQCRTVPYEHCFRGEGTALADMPAVFCSAYESLDGRKALVFGNALDSAEQVGYLQDGEWRQLKLKPHEIKIVER